MTRDELLRPADIEREFGISVNTLSTWRHRGIGPKAFPCGPRRVAYRRSVVEAWIAEQENSAVAS